MFKLLSSPDFALSQIAAIALTLMVFSITIAVLFMKFATKSWGGY